MPGSEARPKMEASSDPSVTATPAAGSCPGSAVGEGSSSRAWGSPRRSPRTPRSAASRPAPRARLGERRLPRLEAGLCAPPGRPAPARPEPIRQNSSGQAARAGGGAAPRPRLTPPPRSGSSGLSGAAITRPRRCRPRLPGRSSGGGRRESPRLPGARRGGRPRRRPWDSAGALRPGPGRGPVPASGLGRGGRGPVSLPWRWALYPPPPQLGRPASVAALWQSTAHRGAAGYCGKQREIWRMVRNRKCPVCVCSAAPSPASRGRVGPGVPSPSSPVSVARY